MQLAKEVSILMEQDLIKSFREYVQSLKEAGNETQAVQACLGAIDSVTYRTSLPTAVATALKAEYEALLKEVQARQSPQPR